MSSDFKWFVVLLDDTPNQLKPAEEKLKEAGFDVLILSDRDGFVDRVNEFRDAHLIVIDMKWDISYSPASSTLTSIYVPKAIENLRLTEYEEARKFVDTWVRAIDDWSSDKARFASNEGNWPKTKIATEQIGVWYGAMLSWIAPDAQLIFFSGFDSAFATGIAAALGVYRAAPFKVHPKKPPDFNIPVIAPSELVSYLVPFQRELLRNEGAKRWFYSSVLIPLLADRQPTEGRCGMFIPSSNSVEVRNLTFSNVFPNLANRDNPADRFKSLLAYLDPPKLTQQEWAALCQTKHDLQHVMRESANQTYLRNAYESACLAGVWGFDIANRLYHVVDRQNGLEPYMAEESIKRLISQATISVDAILADAEPFLKDLFKDHGDNFEYSLGANHHRSVARKHGEQFARNQPSRKPGLMINRFPPIWIRDIFAVLIDNAKSHDCRWKAWIKEFDSCFTIGLVSEWGTEQRLTSTAFWNLVMKSVEKGDSRGLPHVFRRALESCADSCHLKIGTEISSLWGVREPTDLKRADFAEMLFGIELAFEITK